MAHDDAASWAAVPEATPSTEIDNEFYGQPSKLASSTSSTRNVGYPRYMFGLLLLGAAMAIAGFAIALVDGRIWPVGIMVIGLVIFWFGTFVARRSERKRKGRNIAAIWEQLEWISTKSVGSQH